MGITRTEFLARRADVRERVPEFEFLAEAWDGRGGFLPIWNPEPSASSRGSIVTLPEWATRTYLHRHPRERGQKFTRRRVRAAYGNLLRRALGTWLSFFLRQPWKRQSKHPAIQAWFDDCDGHGSPWERIFARWCSAVALYGTSPLVIDRPTTADGERSLADSLHAGGPRAHVWSPQSIADYRLDEQERPVMLRLLYEVEGERHWTASQVTEARTIVWTQTDVEKWAMRANEDPCTTDGYPCPNELGTIPVVLATFDDAETTPFWGYTPGLEVARRAQTEFNDESGLDEHIAAAVFALFYTPKPEHMTAEQFKQSIRVGTDSAIALEAGSSVTPGYASPDKSVADTLFQRKDGDRQEAYRALHLENLLQSSAVATSALARQYERANLDAALRRFALRMQRFDRDAVALVARWYRLDPGDVLDGYTSTPPDDFDVQDVQTLLDNARAAFELPIDDITKIAILRSVSDAVVDLSADEKTDRDKELDELLKALKVSAPGPAQDATKTADEGEPAQETDTADFTTTGVEITPSTQEAVVTMNEARAALGLGPLLTTQGDADPDGKLTVADFKAKREALRGAQAQEGAGVAVLSAKEGEGPRKGR